MKSVNWLKIASIIGMGLSFAGTLLSDYVGQKQIEVNIAEKVKEQFDIYLMSRSQL